MYNLGLHHLLSIPAFFTFDHTRKKWRTQGSGSEGMWRSSSLGGLWISATSICSWLLFLCSYFLPCPRCFPWLLWQRPRWFPRASSSTQPSTAYGHWSATLFSSASSPSTSQSYLRFSSGTSPATWVSRCTSSTSIPVLLPSPIPVLPMMSKPDHRACFCSWLSQLLTFLPLITDFDRSDIVFHSQGLFLS